jgi:hypothetical protein
MESLKRLVGDILTSSPGTALTATGRQSAFKLESHRKMFASWSARPYPSSGLLDLVVV